jgi:hypothetical protein
MNPCCHLIGVGEDGEPLYIEIVHPACILIHAVGNEMSPFEFEKEKDVWNFVKMLCKFRLENRLFFELGS